MSNYINAYNLGKLPKRSRTIEEQRQCKSDGCSTIISKYNKTEHCNNHRPLKYPRVRGKPSNSE
jgi:hypothetical protein